MNATGWLARCTRPCGLFRQQTLRRLSWLTCINIWLVAPRTVSYTRESCTTVSCIRSRWARRTTWDRQDRLVLASPPDKLTILAPRVRTHAKMPGNSLSFSRLVELESARIDGDSNSIDRSANISTAKFSLNISCSRKCSTERKKLATRRIRNVRTLGFEEFQFCDKCGNFHGYVKKDFYFTYRKNGLWLVSAFICESDWSRIFRAEIKYWNLGGCTR